VSLDVHAGECVAVLGESGSGKTQLLMACLGLLAENGRASGSVTFTGKALLSADEATLNGVRGTGMALLSQDPLGALTPHLRIETQLVDGLLDRGLATPQEAWERALQALRDVDVPEPERRLRQYPHELSGGMRQRVALAIAMMCRPGLLMADEPTTALDVRVQALVLQSLARLRDQGLAILLVTHDFGVAAGLADRVAVMYAGRIVELAPTRTLFEAPAHPYTAALLAAVPRMQTNVSRLAAIEGQPPAPGPRQVGCAFRPRCSRASEVCGNQAPSLGPQATHAQVACHHALLERAVVA
jgi:oligopeptide transport system ATP-binding protein